MALDRDHWQDNILDRMAALEQEVSELKAALGRFSTVTLSDGVTAPQAVPGCAILFVDAADGDLKVIFGDGTVVMVADR
jgi:hypothetical protein